MIGDTMETDILGGAQLGFHTVLVLSGGTRREDLARYTYRPDTVVESLGELADHLEKTNWRPAWLAPSSNGESKCRTEFIPFAGTPGRGTE
jgi:NagD protein